MTKSTTTSTSLVRSAPEEVTGEIIEPGKRELSQKNADLLRQITIEIKRGMGEIRVTENILLHLRVKQGFCFLFAKKLLGFGEFGTWRETEFGNAITERVAQRDMKLAQIFYKQSKSLVLPTPTPQVECCRNPRR